jgi:hypothetical protein
LLVTEQAHADENQSQSDDEDVEEVTHTTSTRQGRDEAALHADALAEDDAERYGLRDRDIRAAAHASVLEDWKGHGEERPPEIRFEIWVDPFSRMEPANEMEKWFLQTVRIHERTIRWKQGDPL